jgi:hypothetical protein
MKVEIEHLQHLLEQGRIRMTRDFEAWFIEVYVGPERPAERPEMADYSLDASDSIENPIADYVNAPGRLSNDCEITSVASEYSPEMQKGSLDTKPAPQQVASNSTQQNIKFLERFEHGSSPTSLLNSADRIDRIKNPLKLIDTSSRPKSSFEIRDASLPHLRPQSSAGFGSKLAVEAREELNAFYRAKKEILNKSLQ